MIAKSQSKDSHKKFQVVKQIKGYLRQKFMYSQRAIQEIDELVNNISKAKKHITPDDIKKIEKTVKEKYPSIRNNTSQLSKNRSSVSPFLAMQTCQLKKPIDRNSLNSIVQQQSNSRESSHKLINNFKIPRKGSIDSSQSKRIDNQALLKLKQNRSARKQNLKIVDSDKKIGVEIAALSITTPKKNILSTRDSKMHLNQKSVPNELQQQKQQQISVRSSKMSHYIPPSNKTSSQFNKSILIFNVLTILIAPLVKQSSPHKPNIWAAIMIHDTLKYKQQQHRQKQKLRNQKLELKKFLQEQMRTKNDEKFKKLELKKRQDDELIKASKGLSDNEVAMINQRKNKLSKLKRDEYLNSFDVLSSKKKQVSIVNYLGGQSQKEMEQELEWQAAIREKQFYKSYQIKQIQSRKEKQLFHKRQLHDLINQKQKMKEVEKQNEQKEDRDTLKFVVKSNQQRDFIVRNNQDKINQQHNLREDMFRFSNTNFSLQQKLKYDLIDERINRQQVQQKQKKEQEQNRMQARKNSLKEEMMRGLKQMSQRKKIRDNEVRQSVNRDKQNSKKLVEHFKRQIQLEQQRYQQEKQAKKKVMLTQYKNFMATKMTENSDCLLTPKEFIINKQLMTQMGVQSDGNQGQIANNIASKRYQINPISL